MTQSEFWKLYHRKYKGHMNVIVEDRPLGGDDGFFKISCYRNIAGIWCIEETVERSNTPRRKTFRSERDAFDEFLEKVHYRSEFKNEPVPTSSDIRTLKSANKDNSWLSKILSIVMNPNTDKEELR